VAVAPPAGQPHEYRCDGEGNSEMLHVRSLKVDG
jgi:hypothetical protein